jgi:tRNA(fMet)-specific endonuclease VapC
LPRSRPPSYERATGRHKVTRQRYLDSVLEALPVIPCAEQTAREHRRIWAELRASGKMIGFYDLIVGATAVERGSEEATFNRRLFSQIRGLRAIEPM